MSGAKKECRCPVTVHRHGTLACYRRCGCRCPGCTAANTKAVKAWRAGMVIGDVVGREHVDAAPYRAVLHRLGRNPGAVLDDVTTRELQRRAGSDLDLLRILDAIERHGSFSAAAGALHRVPSALSHAVAKLESELEERFARWELLEARRDGTL